MDTNKQKAIALIKKASHSELEAFIFKVASKDVSVNFLTRSMVEAAMMKELNNYSDQAIGEFLASLK